MAGAVNEVDEVIRNWTAENPTVVGYVVINADGKLTLPTARRGLAACRCFLYNLYALLRRLRKCPTGRAPEFVTQATVQYFKQSTLQEYARREACCKAHLCSRAQGDQTPCLLPVQESLSSITRKCHMKKPFSMLH